MSVMFQVLLFSPEVIHQGACHPDAEGALLLPESPYNSSDLVSFKKNFHLIEGILVWSSLPHRWLMPVVVIGSQKY